MTEINNKEVFSKNLKFYLQRNSTTAKQLSEDLNFRTSTVYDWVNGKTYPRMPKLEAIADYFGISANDLIYPRSDVQSFDDVNTNDLNFGQRLRFIRKSNNETQKNIADLLGLTQATINGYETDNRQPDQQTLIKLANHFHVSTDYLLTGQNKKDFSQEQINTFKQDALEEDTRAMAAHSTNKDVSARGINKEAVSRVLGEYLNTPQGQEHLKKIMNGDAFDLDAEDLK